MTHDLRDFVAALNAESVQGTTAVSTLSKLPLAEWRVIVADNPELSGFGTIRTLLDEAHTELDRDPSRAKAITTFLLEQVGGLELPSALAPLRSYVVGTTWKERANACFKMGDFEDAVRAAETACSLFNEEPTLGEDAAAATFVLAQALHELGRSAEALTLLASCEATFVAFARPTRLLDAMMMRAGIYYDQERLADATSEFTQAYAEAERQQDDRALAKITQNLGACALKSGDFERAKGYLKRSLLQFMSLGMDVEANRAIRNMAHVDKGLGDVEHAVAELERARDEFKALGIIPTVLRIEEELVRMKS